MTRFGSRHAVGGAGARHGQHDARLQAVQDMRPMEPCQNDVLEVMMQIIFGNRGLAEGERRGDLRNATVEEIEAVERRYTAEDGRKGIHGGLQHHQSGG